MSVLLKPIDAAEDTCIMSLKEFIAACAIGAFIDYDGYGHLCTETHESDITISPSDIGPDGYQPPDPILTHVNWFNR